MKQRTFLFLKKCFYYQCTRRLHQNPCPFGLLLDIDGVILRGRKVLPGALQAFRLLTDSQGSFRVPVVFVTNAGSTLRAVKANQLSEKLGVKIIPDQVILSHGPLRMFRQFHDRHVLVCGQGPIFEIAKALGFNKITTVDQLRHAFPNLDCMDYRRRKYTPCAFEKYFPPIEAIVLFSDPIRWETSMQLICDVLMTGGLPFDLPANGIPYPHIPLIACNMDFLWTAEARLPRFGHGAFMLCLETLYKKLTGRELKYTALIGKPSELTYHHAEFCLKSHATYLNLAPPTTIYAIGDNPESDVLGANLFEQFLSQRNLRRRPQAVGRRQLRVGAPVMSYVDSRHIGQDDETFSDHGAEHCYSILVETGVYSPASDLSHQLSAGRHLGDLNSNSVLKTPAFVEQDLFSAVQMIFEREIFT